MNFLSGADSDESPSDLPPGWIARWDSSRLCYFYINTQTGEETLQHPGSYQGGQYDQFQRQQGGSSMGYGAMGAAGGLAGGAGMMYEGEKLEGDYERDKYRVDNAFDNAGGYAERKFDNGIADAENFPDNAARWTGEKVGEVENIPQDIDNDYDRAKYGVENRFDNAVQDVENVPQDIENDYDRTKYGVENRFDNGVQDVENIPQDIEGGFGNVAGWIGNKVGGVERFDQGVDSAYDQGRDQGRDGY